MSRDWGLRTDNTTLFVSLGQTRRAGLRELGAPESLALEIAPVLDLIDILDAA